MDSSFGCRHWMTLNVKINPESQRRSLSTRLPAQMTAHSSLCRDFFRDGKTTILNMLQ